MQTSTRSADSAGRPVRRRLRSLAFGELVNIPLHAAVWIAIIGAPITLPNLVGFLLFAALLIEGAGYWLAKLHQVRTRQRELPGLRVFRLLRLANLPLLAVGVAITGYGAVDAPGLASWPGLGYALFAVLEHLNYFHYQLSYDRLVDLRRLRSFGLRRSHLSRDLRPQDPQPALGPIDRTGTPDSAIQNLTPGGASCRERVASRAGIATLSLQVW